MPRIREAAIPTDAEILAMNSVPLRTAALYIGWSDSTLAFALKQERAPFGFAVQNPELKSWSYNISPGLLVAYKRGTLPTYKLDEVINLAAEGVSKVIDEKLSSVRMIADVMGKARRV
ncbi:MAG: hypothetical protein IJT94_00455 [Oscillibacter sp.]|nr:hypothetical protein [Oscillibacter sp.]